MSHKVINIITVQGNELRKKNVFKLNHIIYRNFNNLIKIPELNHHRAEIQRILTSRNSILILALYKGKIIGYLLAEPTEYNLKMLMHIYYLYTSPHFRSLGIARNLLYTLEKYSIEMKYNTLSLTFDTHDHKLYRFYSNYGFSSDDTIQTKKRFDVLTKYL